MGANKKSHSSTDSALEKELEIYKSLVVHSPDVTMSFDRDFRHVYVSPNIHEFTDIPADQFIGKTHRDLKLPEDQTTFWEKNIARVFNTGEPIEKEFIYDSKKGTIIINWRLFPEYDSTGTIIRVLSQARDVTKHRETEQNFQLLFEKMFDAFALHEILLDSLGEPSDYRFLLINSQFEAVTGLKKENVLGKRVLEILPDTEPFWITMYGEVAQTGEPKRFENYSQALNKYYEVVAYSPQKGQFVTLFQDITDRKKNEEEIQRSQLELEAANKKLNELNQHLQNQVLEEIERRHKQERITAEQQKFADMGYMISAIAHQWRQPLNGLGLILQTIEQESSTETATAPLFVQGMNIIEHLSSTIDDFRNFFTPDKTASSFSIVNAVLSVFRLIDASLKNNNISFSIDCTCPLSHHSSNNTVKSTMCDEKGYLIYGFPGEFKQVLLNILSNARDAVEQEIISGHKKMITATIEQSNSNVILAIHNNGPHISAENLTRIFNPYFTTKINEGGSGIGLYMSRLIIEQHMNGKIYAENRDNGVAFIIELPFTLGDGSHGQ